MLTQVSGVVMKSRLNLKPGQPRSRHQDGDIVPVMVNFSEKALQARLKVAGGKWDPEAKIWRVAFGSIRGTDLEDRIKIELTSGKPG